MATHLVDNQVVISWLTKELKKARVQTRQSDWLYVIYYSCARAFFQNAISKMLTQLGGRGQTTCHVLSVWNHVINILGTVCIQ